MLRSELRVTACVVLFALGSLGCSSSTGKIMGLEVRPNLEDLTADGGMYTPETQSFLRQSHWLDNVDRADIVIDDDGDARIDLASEGSDDYVTYRNVPIDFVLPRLYYRAAKPADEFDAFNLMLAEYSRNSVDFPFGEPKDEMTHFETSLDVDSAWDMPENPYEFKPNSRFRPLRMALVNNCLGPGLWELSAKDNAGEIYHAWLSFPGDRYVELVARANGLDPAFVEPSLLFNEQPVPLRLERLRDVESMVASAPATLIGEGSSGYSSQGSRKKLRKGYVLAEKGGEWKVPEQLGDLTTRPLRMSEFVEPGKYSTEKRREFDLGYLRAVRGAEVFVVKPKTSYHWLDDPIVDPMYRGGRYFEFRIHLDEYTVVLGNLPAALLVPQEDFSINGFGVGVQSSGEPAERRRLLVKDGPAPSFAYIAHRDGDELIGANSHELGLEQVFIRTRFHKGRAVWEVTFTSYERIVDLVKYEIEIPSELVDEMNELRRRYIAPVFLTYRDDNVR